MLVFMSWEQFVVTSSRKSYQVGFQTLPTQTMRHYFDLFLMKQIFWQRENVFVNEMQIGRNRSAGFRLAFIGWYQLRRKRKSSLHPLAVENPVDSSAVGVSLCDSLCLSNYSWGLFTILLYNPSLHWSFRGILWCKDLRRRLWICG